MIFPVPINHLPEVLLCPVPPPALTKPKGKFRGDIASSNQLPKLLYNLIGRFPFDHIQIQIGIRTADFQNIRKRIPNIKCKLCRIIYKQAKIPFPCDHEKIVGAIQRPCTLQMLRIVRGIADITMPPFVHPSDCFAKSIDHIIL